MRDRIEDIRAAGAELVIVGNGSEHFARAFREDFDLDGPLLLDPELRAYRAAGLRRGRVEVLSPRLPGNALRALRAGSRQTGIQGDPWQLGGVFVIRTGGELAYRHASAEAGDHPPLDEVLEALAPESGARVAEEEERASLLQRLAGRALSRVVDPTIVASFDRTGFRVHSLAFDPEDLQVDLSGRRCLVTGANSGIGFETALGLADLGAEAALLCRSAERGEAARDRIRERTGNPNVSFEQVDVGDLASVREAAARLATRRVDVLVHNAGLLPDERRETPQGLELTFAVHVVGPYLLTELLRPALEKSDDARVIWVSSGGMYTRRLDVSDPNWRTREYDGVRAYAETKRAQVVLSELLAEAYAGGPVTVNAMHPGWAATPSVERSLPRFHRLMQRVLRTPAEGADTVVWLAAAPRLRGVTGRFFFDREERRTHLVPFTRESEDQRRALLELCRREAAAA